VRTGFATDPPPPAARTGPTDHRRRVIDLELFADCPRDELDRIESLTTTVHVRPGRTLWRPGRSDRQFLVVVDGEATVTVDGVDVATLGSGCGFGPVVVVTPQGRREATVVAATAMTLLVLHRGELHTLIREAPVVARHVQRATTSRLTRPLLRTTRKEPDS
jgi:CRP-like cAMP-binding protein